MEGYPYSTVSYPDSGESSPRSREIDYRTWDDQSPPATRAKFMCSYGGRIQPRVYDNQLTYVGGETKILAVDRSIRFPAMISRLSSLSGADELLLKYQLPGEDLDALVSVTNEEDLDNMMLEYDRLHRSGSRPIQRLRLFVFPPIGKCDRSSPVTSQIDPEPVAVAVTETGGPDYLFGLDKGFVPPPAVKVRDPAPESAFTDAATAGSEIGEADAVFSPAEMQKHVNELQRLQVPENSNMQRNGSEETLARLYPGEYYAPRGHDQSPPAPNPAPPTAPQQAAYWPDHHRSMAPAGVFAGGADPQFYFIPAVAPPGQSYYTTMQRMVPAPSVAFDGAPAAAAMYTVPASPAQAHDSGMHLAYDSTGRVVCYPAVGSVAMNPESKTLKPPKVS